jgi:hypothetical protein
MRDMARIVITTFGSTGDLNPFVALGLALRSNGHDVLFAVEANFEPQGGSGSAHLGRVPVCRFHRCRDAPDSLDISDSDTLNAPLSFNRGAAHACAITRTSATLEQSLLLQKSIPLKITLALVSHFRALESKRRSPNLTKGDGRNDTCTAVAHQTLDTA